MKRNEKIDGTEFACLTINADLEVENEKLKNQLALKKDLDKEIEKLEKELAELKAQKEKKKWKFTEDESVILRNLPEEYKWIARDNNDNLWLYSDKPEKSSNYDVWKLTDDVIGEQFKIIEFNHLFQCIQWSDEQPCEFRKFI